MAKTYSTIEFSAAYPEAFADLPEPYQNDSCLEFSDKGDSLICYPAKGQEEALGRWVASWSGKNKWKVIYPPLKDQSSDKSNWIDPAELLIK